MASNNQRLQFLISVEALLVFSSGDAKGFKISSLSACSKTPPPRDDGAALPKHVTAVARQATVL